MQQLRYRRARRKRRMIVVAGLIASLLGIFSFVTGQFTLAHVLYWGKELWASIQTRLGVQPPPVSDEFVLRARQRLDSAIIDYEQELKSVTSSRSSVEDLLRRADRIEQILFFGQNPADWVSLFDRLSSTDIEDLNSKLVGIKIWKGDTLAALEIDSYFFLTLSRKYGTPADVAYFEAYRQTYPRGNIWPAYTKPVTDYSGCTDYASGKLVDLFEIWGSYSSRYPGDYTDRVYKITEAISEEFTHDTCACDDADSVIRELSRFVNSSTESRLVNQVRARLISIESGKTDFRFHCRPG